MREGGGDEPSLPWFLPTLTTLETYLGLCHTDGWWAGLSATQSVSRSVGQTASPSTCQSVPSATRNLQSAIWPPPPFAPMQGCDCRSAC